MVTTLIKQVFFLIFLSGFFSVGMSSICVFLPPSTWKTVSPEKLSEPVQVGFVSPKTGSFHPSLNLATEETSNSLQEYVQIVKKLHQDDPQNKVILSLGKFSTKSGDAELLQITSHTSYGDVIILQSILIHEKTAFVLTGSVLKSDLLHVYKTFLDSFRSIHFLPDLFADLSPSQKELFEKEFSFSQKLLKEGKDPSKELSRFEKFLHKNFEELGSHWQLLALKKLATASLSSNP